MPFHIIIKYYTLPNEGWAQGSAATLQKTTITMTSSPETKTVYIAVIGDSGVGKTSLITAASTETFPEHPPPVLPPARLPADTTPEGVPVVITDTSSRPEDKQALESACREASVIVLCFSMDKPQTLRRVSSHWLPELRKMAVTVPVILVGCKSDVRPADQSLHQAVLPIVKTFPQIETCMECSAKNLQFVGEVFYYALKAVIHPMAPLYEPEAQKLRPLCARALKRIFMLCDTDQDGILDDIELNNFQVHCFNAPLQTEELVGVKQVVSEKCPEGIARIGLTLKGFLFLHALFIERGRLETTWTVLRRFGYNNILRLRSDVISKGALPTACPDQVVELTPSGRAFFTSVFEKFDADNDGALSLKERDDMFSTAPEDPWKSNSQYEGVLVETTKHNGILTLQGYLAMWAYTAALDPQAALAGAIYLGFPESAPVDQLLAVSKTRRQEKLTRVEGSRRCLYQCLAFAPRGVDARPVLEGLITQAKPAHGAVHGIITAAVATIQPLPPSAENADNNTIDNSSTLSSSPIKSCDTTPASTSPRSTTQQQTTAPTITTTTTMILRSVSEDQAAALLQRPTRQEELQRCDAALFIFDGAQPETFRSALENMVTIASASGDVLPCVMVCLNQDHMSPAQIAEVGSACSALGINSPLNIPQITGPGGTSPRPSANVTALRSVYQTIVHAAIRPEESMAIPETPSLKATKQYRSMLRRGALIAAGGTVAGLAAYFAYRYIHARESSGGEGGKGEHNGR
jgi:mitochondrial Rho GTPase 1